MTVEAKNSKREAVTVVLNVAERSRKVRTKRNNHFGLIPEVINDI